MFFLVCLGNIYLIGGHAKLTLHEDTVHLTRVYTLHLNFLHIITIHFLQHLCFLEVYNPLSVHLF